LFQLFTVLVVDARILFTTVVVDAGNNLPPVSLIPVANWQIGAGINDTSNTSCKFTTGVMDTAG
jgi:hypothetical protein